MSTLGDFEFDSAQFENFVQPTFSSLFTLLREAKECDTKMSVLTCMSLVVDKMGECVQYLCNMKMLYFIVFLFSLKYKQRQSILHFN